MQIYNSTISNIYKYPNITPSSNYKLRVSSRNEKNSITPNFRHVLSSQQAILKKTNAFKMADLINQYFYKFSEKMQQIPFRNYDMGKLEGLQYGIKVFEGLTMKDIQYLSENLHVIAVKRGCNNMCGHCYADAKPSKREMSWEDFTTITQGYKELRKRLGKIPLFGENLPCSDAAYMIHHSTELFYDSDCMNIAIKDKHGKLYDFTELTDELYNSTGRKTIFDTSGWVPSNDVMQKRAEKYAEHFSKKENMDKLHEFNLSFNVFNGTYVAGVKAALKGDKETFNRLKNKYTDRISNAIYTFTPLLSDNKFNILVRSFGLNAKHADYFDVAAMLGLIHDVTNKVERLYKNDLKQGQKYVKSESDINTYMNITKTKLSKIDFGLNSAGRMKQFMESFKIKAPMQNHDEMVDVLAKDLEENGRQHRYLCPMLIDTDGRVHHMVSYTGFFPTEIQLNLQDKSPTPTLANIKGYTIKSSVINRSEILE